MLYKTSPDDSQNRPSTDAAKEPVLKLLKDQP
jgi:hypothetical protein